MIKFRFIGKEDDLIKLRDTLHHALVRSPAYVKSEIVISDPYDKDGELYLPFIVGDDTDNDIQISINYPSDDLQLVDL